MGTIRRDADPEELFRAIRSIALGNAWFDPVTANGMLSAAGPHRDGAEGGGSPLTGRELDVAVLIAEGCSNKEIAGRLELAEATVKKHVGKVLEKLGTPDRLQAGLLIARNPASFKR